MDLVINLVSRFCETYNCDRGLAHFVLTQFKWNLEKAEKCGLEMLDLFAAFDVLTKADVNNIQELYIRYSVWEDSEGGERRLSIRDVGLVYFKQDIGLQDVDRLYLILAWKLKAKSPLEFTQSEFVEGMKLLDVDNLDDLLLKLVEIDSSLEIESKEFREFYRFAFKYTSCLSYETLDYKLAIVYWERLMGDKVAYSCMWTLFVERDLQMPIEEDIWTSWLDFVLKVDPNMDNFDPRDNWPSVFSEFVAYARPYFNSRGH